MKPLPPPEVAAILDYAKAKTQDGSLVEVLESFRTSADSEHRKWWAQVVASYGVGLPGKRQEVRETDPEKIIRASDRLMQEFLTETDRGNLLAEAARRARERRDSSSRPAALAPSPTPEPLNSAGASGRPGLPPAPAPLEKPVAPPEPTVAQKPEVGPDGWPKPTHSLTIYRGERE